MSELETLCDVLKQFEIAGENPAVLTVDDHLNALSYAELFRAATRVAGHIHRCDPIPGGPNSLNWTEQLGLDFGVLGNCRRG